MTALLAAFSLQDKIEQYGAYAGIAAVFGLGVLALLYFAQAREVKRLRDWAGRAPERAAELEARVTADAQRRATPPAPAPAPRPTAPATPAAQQGAAPAPGVAAPATAAAAAAGAGAAATATSPPATAPTNGTGSNAAVPPPTKPGEAKPAEAKEDGEAKKPAEGADKPATPAEPANGASKPATPEAGKDAEEKDGDGAPKPVVPAAATAAATAATAPAAAAAATPGPRPQPAAPLRAPTPSASLPPRTPAGARARTDTPDGRSRGRPAAIIGAIVGAVAIVAVLAVVLFGGGSDKTPPKPNTVTPPSASGTGDGAGGGSTPKAAAKLDRKAVPLAVLNGTTVTGLARAAADKLTAKGYNEPNVVTNDTTNQARRTTEILYESKARAAALDVAKILGVTAAAVKPIDANGRALADRAQVAVFVGADKAQ